MWGLGFRVKKGQRLLKLGIAVDSIATARALFGPHLWDYIGELPQDTGPVFFEQMDTQHKHSAVCIRNPADTRQRNLLKSELIVIWDLRFGL